MHIDYNLLVVGGGINGAAIARDAAGRGARVLLIEKDDLAANTSSASSKLIHGGLRYLEHWQFRLVAEALVERERLISSAPHLIRPLQFVLPHDRDMRPAWMIRLGLFLYDRLGPRQRLPSSKGVRFGVSEFGAGLQPRFTRGFVFSDCSGDDSRLVVANAKDAAERGARILTRTRLMTARRDGAKRWFADLQDERTGKQDRVTARVLVNATGSWAGRFLIDQLGINASVSARLVKGSHIVTRRLFEGSHAYVLQNADRRIVFVIPYERKFTLIGTTDVAWEGEAAKPSIDPAEVAYLCDTVNRCMTVKITSEDIVWSFSGLRPLYDDAQDNPSSVSRDYRLAVDAGPEAAPVLSVFGGKITTHRALGERAVNLLRPYISRLGSAWTAKSTLTGGDVPAGDLIAYAREFASEAPFLSSATIQRWTESYGTRANRILGGAKSLSALGIDFGAGLTEAEVNYLVTAEWATTAEDILWRRSKLGLHMSAAGVASLANYLQAHGRRRQSDPLAHVMS